MSIFILLTILGGNVMKKEDWIEYYKTVHGKSPNEDQIREAQNLGEFIDENKTTTNTSSLKTVNHIQQIKGGVIRNDNFNDIVNSIGTDKYRIPKTIWSIIKKSFSAFWAFMIKPNKKNKISIWKFLLLGFIFLGLFDTITSYINKPVVDNSNEKTVAFSSNGEYIENEDIESGNYYMALTKFSGDADSHVSVEISHKNKQLYWELLDEVGTFYKVSIPKDATIELDGDNNDYEVTLFTKNDYEKVKDNYVSMSSSSSSTVEESSTTESSSTSSSSELKTSTTTSTTDNSKTESFDTTSYYNAIQEHLDKISEEVGSTEITFTPRDVEPNVNINLSSLVASFSTTEIKTLVTTLNEQLVVVAHEHGLSNPAFFYNIEGMEIGKNRYILNPNEVKFKNLD